MPSTGETLLFANELTITNAIDIDRPIARSYVPVASGTRNAMASTPTITFSVTTSLDEATVRNVCGRNTPISARKTAHR